MPIYEPGTPSPDPTWKIIMIYGDLGARKTSMAMTAKNSILFDFNQGSGKAYNSKNKVRMIIENWEEVAHYARTGMFDKYAVPIIDTAQDALNRFLAEAIIREYPAMEDKNGGLTQAGYGHLFRTFQKEFLNYLDGKILIIIAHADSEEINGIKRQTPLIGGKTGQFLGSLANLIGYVSKVDDKVYIDFSSSGNFVSKGMEGLGRIEVPHYSDPSWPTFFQDQIIDKRGWKDLVITPKPQPKPEPLREQAVPVPSQTKSVPAEIPVPTPTLSTEAPAPTETKTVPSPTINTPPSPTQEPDPANDEPPVHKPAVNISVPPPVNDETALVSEWTQRIKAITTIEELNLTIFEKKQVSFQKGPNDVLLRSLLKEKIKEIGAILDKATGLYSAKPVAAPE